MLRVPFGVPLGVLSCALRWGRTHLGRRRGHAELRASAASASKVERRERASMSRIHPHLNTTASLALGYLGCHSGCHWGCFHVLLRWGRRTHLGRRRGAEGKHDTYEQGREAKASVRVAHMAPYFTQLRGQAKGRHASQRSSSGQPGECHLSSPQRHARRRRGELRAHWDAGERLDRGRGSRGSVGN